MKPIALFLFSFFPALAYAQPYKIDYAQSTIAFAGEHAGKAFNGTFETWDADILLDKTTPEKSRFNATFNTASAKTGEKQYDGSLPKKDWFDSETYPEATFSSEAISQKEDGSFHAKGILTIRGISHPAMFDFTLADAENGAERASANLTVDRLAYDIGKGSDATAEWVSKDITVTLDIVASPQN